MVHRDVKPANCLFVDGELKLADFGLLTETGPHVSRVGTEKYMPPDGRMDTRADVYAAGLVIYEMLTGLPADRFPHLGRRASELVANGRNRSCAPPIVAQGYTAICQGRLSIISR
jgi:serine/threonine protein kinase